MRDEVEATYRDLGVNAKVVTFIDDMARAYSNAALVVARAGATTLAELCAIGRPSILVPFPFAADDHQAKNAKALEEQGATICIRESELEVEDLGDAVRGLLDDPIRRRTMAEAARAHGKPDAAAAIVDDILGWIGGSESRELSVATGASEPPRGHQYAGLAVAPAFHFGAADVAMRPVAHRPRRPVVVDGAVWE
jgi:UDP-N-acetylglucosamine--N-acetylmuramyl-(pentapeptide) pyrophosphoryl-undecaprenol N-acetylglucosamine transferase